MKAGLCLTLFALGGLTLGQSVGATVFNINLSQDSNTYTAGYSDGGLGGAFSDTFNFFGFVGNSFADLSLVNVGVGNKKIIFSSVTLDGVDLTSLVISGPSSQTLLISGLPLSGAFHSLVVSGTAGGNASFGGNVNFTLAPIPEPSSWALMIAGITTMGMMMRRRSQRLSFS